ncbi:MAG: hypothetical protein WCJ25_01515 [Candidatus Moraniibacteriota bacterium]
MTCFIGNLSGKQKAIFGGVLLLVFGLVIGLGVGYKVGESRTRASLIRQQGAMMRQGFDQGRGGVSGGGRRMNGYGSGQANPNQGTGNGTTQIAPVAPAQGTVAPANTDQGVAATQGVTTAPVTGTNATTQAQ